jgi:hypothetical protein
MMWHDVLVHLENNWHKYGVAILFLAQAWKYVVEYIRPMVHHDKESHHINITIPKQGCTIKIDPR